MASDALEEKINKIRLQNEEIRRRHEEVEADKKNAAKSNALVQLVPSDDWPERKEPPEFSAPPKNTQKQKSVGKEHSDRPSQHYPGIQERLGKKDHKFAQGEGPPPDPKYNFLADSEREMRGGEDVKSDEDKNKSRNKTPRGGARKRGNGGGAGGGSGGSREAFFKDNRGPNAFHSREESLPEYEAWRAERNRIDEARIKRQKTAEGNWRREWDSNKTSVDKEPLRKGDSNRKDYERKNNYYNNDYSNRGHGGSGSRTYHGSQKNHGQPDHRRPHHEPTHEFKRDTRPVTSPTDDRSIAAIDKSIKVTVNQTKGPVMSVKVNSPSIAGTGRVGPRQKSRVTYSSQSDAEMSAHEVSNFSRQKSFDEKTAVATFNNGQKAPPKSPFAQRKKDANAKSPFPQRKEYKNDESSGRPNKNPKAPRNEGRDQRQSNNSASKPQRVQKRTQKPITDINETVSSSDNAIPSEYNPEKPLNPVESEELKFNETNSENISDESNVADLTLQDTVGKVEDSLRISEQNECDNLENAVVDNNQTVETTEDIETDVNTEHVENIENNLGSESNQNNDQVEIEEVKSEISNVNEEIKCEEIEYDNKEENSNEKSVEPELQTSEAVKEEDPTSTSSQENTSEVVEKNHTSTSSEESTSELVEKNHTSTSLQENSSEVVEKNHTSTSSEENSSELVEKNHTSISLQENTSEVVEKNHTSTSSQENTSELVEKNHTSTSSLENSLEVVENNHTSTSLQENSLEVVENNHTSSSSQENSLEVVENATEEIKVVTVSDDIEKIETISVQNNDELTETNTSESQQINEIESDITSVTNVTDNLIELEKLDNKNQDDNVDDKINDESIEIGKTRTVEVIDSQNISANDSGFIDDSDNFNNASKIEFNKGNTEKSSQESDKSDSVVLTKEICEKTEICDIRCAASSEIPQAVEEHVEKNEEKPELSNALEDSTKDCEVNIEKHVNESLETSKIIDLPKVTDNEKPVEGNVVEEKSTTIATEESKKD